jgi:flagellar hook-associated protein 2
MAAGMPSLAGSFSGIDPKLVENLIKAEAIPVDQAKKRREKVVEEKTEFEKLSSMINDLDTSLNGLKSKADFYKMKVDSSHPDIMEGTVSSYALLGTYEFEVRSLARNEKELAYGFPDKNETPVGFGYMLVEREDMEPFEVVIEPNSTLSDVASQINEQEAGVKAMVVNTKYKPDAFRLLVVSEQSGAESKIYLDEDTTFLEFKEQVTGRNLDVLFEDVPITDEDNVLDELIEGVSFTVKRSEPGTRVQVNIVHDIDGTIEGISGFIEKYNEINNFIGGQFKDPRQGDPGKLASDSSIKQIMRQLQFTLFAPQSSNSKFHTLAQIGIKSDPKTGALQMDEAKVREALADDYDSVAQLFIRSKNGNGLGERMALKIKGFRDPASGVLKTRVRGMESIIKTQDKDIARRERQLQEREVAIKRKFSALDTRMNSLKAQGNFLSQRFGGGAAPGGGK